MIISDMHIVSIAAVSYYKAHMNLDIDDFEYSDNYYLKHSSFVENPSTANEIISIHELSERPLPTIPNLYGVNEQENIYEEIQVVSSSHLNNVVTQSRNRRLETPTAL